MGKLSSDIRFPNPQLHFFNQLQFGSHVLWWSHLKNVSQPRKLPQIAKCIGVLLLSNFLHNQFSKLIYVWDHVVFWVVTVQDEWKNYQSQSKLPYVYQMLNGAHIYKNWKDFMISLLSIFSYSMGISSINLSMKFVCSTCLPLSLIFGTMDIVV